MTVDVDGLRASYLTAGTGGPVVLLLHGTWWSRVWQPVLDELAAAVGADEPLAVAGHDIGGAVAQHLLVGGMVKVRPLALVNSVTYDSWPVPGVARFRDPAVVAAVTAQELLAARRTAVTTALARPATEAELADYLDPWNDSRVRRSWMALAGADDSRHTLDLVPALRADGTPKLLVWGEDDTFQEVRYAERFAAEMPNTTLVRVPGAGHIPMENAPATVAAARPWLRAYSWHTLTCVRSFLQVKECYDRGRAHRR